jgi:tetratricopeptide (TPR) repeat protein
MPRVSLRARDVSAIGELDHPCPVATDGEIAAINLESVRLAAWARFGKNPRSPGAAESVVYSERMTLQFLGDPWALDRLDTLATQLASVDDSSHAVLVHAQVASMAHRFGEARRDLVQAAKTGGCHETIELSSLTIDQACGVNLHAVLAARRRIAVSGRLEDLVPLGAVLADLERFAEADAVYRQAFRSYEGMSPFPMAWVCFQLGMLWGELMPAPDRRLAMEWYRRAVAYLPPYVRARVHLAEIHTCLDQTRAAEALLAPALSSGDPEVRWRLADVMMAEERFEEADTHLDSARSGFEALLGGHLLAFADHAAEFYAGSGNDGERALYLARANLLNRPTRRALRQTRAIAAGLPVQGERP